MSEGEVGFIIIISLSIMFVTMVIFASIEESKPKYKQFDWLEWYKKNNHLFKPQIPLLEALRRKEVQNTDGDGI
jgi:hypothetical protein